jgi:hypothetical protein
MNVDQEFDTATELARRLKLELVAAWTPGKPVDMMNHAVVFRGDRVVGQVFAEQDKGGSPQAAYTAAGFMRADVVFAISDGLTISAPKANVASLKRGELSRRWNEGDREGISEVITALRITPDDVELREWPYVREGNRLHWTKFADWRKSGRVVGGDILAGAREGFEFRRTKFKTFEAMVGQLAPAAFADDPERAEIHLDRAVARFVSQTGGPVALFHPPAAFMEGEELPVESLRSSRHG